MAAGATKPLGWHNWRTGWVQRLSPGGGMKLRGDLRVAAEGSWTVKGRHIKAWEGGVFFSTDKEGTKDC